MLSYRWINAVDILPLEGLGSFLGGGNDDTISSDDALINEIKGLRSDIQPTNNVNNRCARTIYQQSTEQTSKTGFS